MMALLLTIMAIAATSVPTKPAWDYVYTDRHGSKHFVDFQSVKVGKKNTADLKKKIQFAPVGGTNGANVEANAISHRVFSVRLDCFHRQEEILNFWSYDANGREIAPSATRTQPILNFMHDETTWSEKGFARACSGGLQQ